MVVAMNCVGIERCTEKKSFQQFQRLNFVQAVNTAVPAELWFKNSYLFILPDMTEHLQFTLGDTIRPYYIWRTFNFEELLLFVLLFL